MRNFLDQIITKILANHYEQAPEVPVDAEQKIVIFSDLHLGNGSEKDDFLHNSTLFCDVLEKYYLDGGFHLILNGDIEELHRFSMHSITRHWPRFYGLMKKFQADQRLTKMIGNHDSELMDMPEKERLLPVEQSIRLKTEAGTLYVYHGHQSSIFFRRFNNLAGFLLRYLVNPLGIPNRSAAHNSLRRYTLERRAYKFSRQQKIVSILGHTHRPLFESLSRRDSLKYRVEQLCRLYPQQAEKEKEKVRREIARLKTEIRRISLKENILPGINTLYTLNDGELEIPCLFNSGCVIGKRGMTAIEISDGKIALVHWFDSEVSRKHLDENHFNVFNLEGTTFHRIVFKEDDLKYIFARIDLLA